VSLRERPEFSQKGGDPEVENPPPALPDKRVLGGEGG